MTNLHKLDTQFTTKNTGKLDFQLTKKTYPQMTNLQQQQQQNVNWMYHMYNDTYGTSNLRVFFSSSTMCNSYSSRRNLLFWIYKKKTYIGNQFTKKYIYIYIYIYI